MVDLKVIADLVTIIRGFMAFVLVWLGIKVGGESLGLVVFIMIGCWTGDFIDGRLARRSRLKRQTWIGDHDVQVDFIVSLGLGAYLLWSGYVNQSIGLVYLVIWGITIWWKGPDRNLLMLFQAPIYFYLIIISMKLIPETGRWIIIWISVILMLNWKKFSTEIVPNFISGFIELWSHRNAPKKSE